jgi:hypothetical protein
MALIHCEINYIVYSTTAITDDPYRPVLIVAGDYSSFINCPHFPFGLKVHHHLR